MAKKKKDRPKLVVGHTPYAALSARGRKLWRTRKNKEKAAKLAARLGSGGDE